PEYKPNGAEVAVITTSKGTIRVQLAGNDAPIHVGNFIELATKGFYNDLKFHRYVPDFVVQGGDPNMRELDTDQVRAAADNPYAGLGTGGPGYCIKEEFSTNPNNSHEDGALAMARSQAPDSAGSQFYFCLGAQHFLDPNYTVFGQTIEGKDVIAQLRVGDVIESIVIEGAND
ncbi:MAG: peptidylprolyl isomerase, partial [Eggerthellaceae bacterium]|nr:peptidylprolyl isomerase [Eggerthellaceae bacterium]